MLGSDIDFGTLECEPKIKQEVFPSVGTVVHRDIRQMLDAGRIRKVAEAGLRLAKAHPDVPVIGSVTGPVSTAASIVDPMRFLCELRKDRENSHRVLTYVADFLIAYARLLVDGGPRPSASAIPPPPARSSAPGPSRSMPWHT